MGAVERDPLVQPSAGGTVAGRRGSAAAAAWPAAPRPPAPSTSGGALEERAAVDPGSFELRDGRGRGGLERRRDEGQRGERRRPSCRSAAHARRASDRASAGSRPPWARRIAASARSSRTQLVLHLDQHVVAPAQERLERRDHLVRGRDQGGGRRARPRRSTARRCRTGSARWASSRISWARVRVVQRRRSPCPAAPGAAARASAPSAAGERRRARAARAAPEALLDPVQPGELRVRGAARQPAGHPVDRLVEVTEEPVDGTEVQVVAPGRPPRDLRRRARSPRASAACRTRASRDVRAVQRSA